MDSDDAVDILEDLEESTKHEIVKRLDEDAGEDVDCSGLTMKTKSVAV